MQKDFKIGLGVGLLFVVGVALWLSTRPDLSTEARALQSASTRPANEMEVYRGRDKIQTPNIESAFANASADKHRTSNNELRTTPVPSEARPEWNRRVEGNAEKTLRIHVVQKGETLSAIAAKYYGSSNQWPKIVAANRSNLPDPNRLIPGTRLVIPE
jgi:nucleoid-associated protein YgaU